MVYYRDFFFSRILRMVFYTVFKFVLTQMMTTSPLTGGLETTGNCSSFKRKYFSWEINWTSIFVLIIENSRTFQGRENIMMSDPNPTSTGNQILSVPISRSWLLRARPVTTRPNTGGDTLPDLSIQIPKQWVWPSRARPAVSLGTWNIFLVLGTQ